MSGSHGSVSLSINEMIILYHKFRLNSYVIIVQGPSLALARLYKHDKPEAFPSSKLHAEIVWDEPLKLWGVVEDF